MGWWIGRVAIVTGGAGGIGLAIAAKVVSGGGSVVVGDMNGARGEAAVRELGQRGRFVRADASTEGDIEQLVVAAVDGFGRVDAMFNNAGVGGAFGPIVEQSVEAWDETFAINTRSVFLGTKHAARQMIGQGDGGAIVNTASIAGLAGGGGPQAYSASKAAVIGLTRALAREIGRNDIRVNAIAPTAVITEGTREFFGPKYEGALDTIKSGQAIPRNPEADDMVGTVMWLISDASKFVTGQTISIDGGTVLL